ncbi:MAG: hypothetical protein ACRYGM_05250 [Janthinobacterium lividum]
MRSFPNIASFVRHLATVPAAVHEAQRHGEEEQGAVLVQTAHDMIGMEMPKWAALAESTVAEKRREGFTGRVSGTDPLYRTGELRLSISYRIEGSSLLLGATDPIAAYQEFGTDRIPPRPFIGATMFSRGHEAADRIALHMMSAFGGTRPAAPRKS